MRPNRHARLGRHAIAALGILLFGPVEAAVGQVGITSRTAQVRLVARVAPRGSLPTVGEIRETGRFGLVREVSTRVLFTCNVGHRLMVKRSAGPAARIWVRAATGEFRELTVGSSMTLRRDPRGVGMREREVEYRIEVPEGGEQRPAPLPVRYEIAIDLTL